MKNKNPLSVILILVFVLLLFVVFTKAHAQYYLPTLDTSSPADFVSSLPISPPWLIGPLANSSIFAPQAIVWGYSFVPTSPWY